MRPGRRELKGAIVWRAAFVALLFGFAQWAPAAVTVELTRTPMGGYFHYDVAITNGEAVDLAIVSILDAPLVDPWIDPSLVVPAGFLGSYDGGLGIVDFLGDVGVFAAGTTTSGFSFDSLGSPPDFFRSFGALGVNGEAFGDFVLIDNPPVAPVPEPSRTLLMLALGLGLLGMLERRTARLPRASRASM
jgi:hypothetical protein